MSVPFKTIRPLIHKSGWPWMRAACCGERVNHMGAIKRFDKPEVYGGFDPATQQVATHTQEMSCKCGNARLIVEGTPVEYEIHGCFLTEKK